MKKYKVIVNIYTAVMVEVEAESKEAAEYEAEQQAQADGVDLSDMEFEADSDGDKMNKSEAYKLDKKYAIKHKENPFYVEEDDGVDYIFGLESGFAYSSPHNPKEKIEDMWDEMKQEIGIKENTYMKRYVRQFK